MCQNTNKCLIGDNINIDQYTDNLQSQLEVRALQPTLDLTMLSNNLKRMNKEPTRHSPASHSTLLDLILTSDPNSIKDVTNFQPGLSEYDGVSCLLVCKDVNMKPQFHTKRNYKFTTASNIIPRVDTNEKLQKLFNSSQTQPRSQ